MAVASIKTNVAANFTATNIGSALDDIKRSSIRLSSGEKITQAKDDAAGLSIGVGLKTDESTLTAALTTATQAGVVMAIADNTAASVTELVSRLKSLASQSNSGALGSAELGYIKNEMDALVAQVDTVVNTTKFNGRVLLDGSFTGVSFQVGLASTDTIEVTMSDSRAAALGINALDVTTSTAAANAALDTAINTLKSTRAQIGALQSRFSYAAANLQSSVTNTSAAASVYLDADIATTSTELAAQRTQMQAAISALAQMNNLPADLLKLLG
jgi:flagellin